MTYGKFLIPWLVVTASLVQSGPALSAPGDKANLSGLADVTFGTIGTFNDRFSSQSVCAYSASSTSRYSVTALGNGPGGSFALTSGSAQLPYEVLWSPFPGQTNGTNLVAGSTQPGLDSGATQKTCNNGPSTSASLTVVLRSSALSSARAGNYSGTLQLTIAPE